MKHVANVDATVLSAASLTAERTLALHDALIPLFPDGGLVRGRSVVCTGVTATSVALALTSAAVAAGGWLGVVGVPWLGAEAAAELGVPLERLVRIDPGASAGRRRSEAWADLMASVLDGFEIVITRVPASTGATLIRRVQQRMQARGAVVIAIGDHAAWPGDVRVRARRARWEGVADGHGCLRARRVEIESSGRRVPRARAVDLWLPGPTATIEAMPAELRPTG
ncbi:MAG: hypothetical protein ACK5OX_19930 [Desertimonas sp.]